MRKLTIAGFVAAALVAVACGGDPDDRITVDPGTAPRGTAAAESKPPVKTAKVGGNLTVKREGVNATWTLEKVEQADADQFGIEPDNGGRWLLVKVAVKVSDGREANVCSCDLAVVSKSGKVYEQGFGSFKGRPDLNAATVAAGQNVDGWVAFGVAKADLTGARLQLKQQALLSDTGFGYWDLGIK